MKSNWIHRPIMISKPKCVFEMDQSIISLSLQEFLFWMKPGDGWLSRQIRDLFYICDRYGNYCVGDIIIMGTSNLFYFLVKYIVVLIEKTAEEDQAWTKRMVGQKSTSINIITNCSYNYTKIFSSHSWKHIPKDITFFFSLS